MELHETICAVASLHAGLGSLPEQSVIYDEQNGTVTNFSLNTSVYLCRS